MKLNYLLVFIFLVRSLLCLSSDVLTLYTSCAATTEWRLKSIVNMFLGIYSDHEARDVDNLPANTNVTLEDQCSGMMHAVSNPTLEHNRLQPTLQELA
jgi:hypothetical protein